MISRKFNDTNGSLFCNKCGNKINLYEVNTVTGSKQHMNSFYYEATASWGYYSCGKDTDKDSWILCCDCFNSQILDLPAICSICKEDVVEVMADLASRDAGHRDYKNKEEAYKYYKKENIEEYVDLNGRIFCESCYEKFILSFVIPAKVSEDDVWGFLGKPFNESKKSVTKDIKEDRIKKHLASCRGKYAK